MTSMQNLESAELNSTAVPVSGPTEASASFKRSRLLTIWAIRIGFLIVMLGSWQASATENWINPLFTSSPSAIWKALGTNTPTIVTQELPTTLIEMAIGLLSGCAVGFVAGVILGRSDVLNAAFGPIYVALNSLPRIALAPLFIIWFGLGISSKIALSFTLVVFIVMINTIAGLTDVDRDSAMLAKSMGVGEWRRLWVFQLPAAVPVLAAAVELGIVYSFLGVITGELVGGSRGLGVLMAQQATAFQTADFFATLLVLAVVTATLTQLMHFGTKRLLRWHRIEMRGLS